MKNFFNFFKKIKAFSFIEVMLSLVIISAITASFVPVMTKKITGKKINVTPKMTYSTNCPAFTNPSNGGTNSSSCGKCAFCDLKKGASYCIACTCNCPNGSYKIPETCSCATCATNCEQCKATGECKKCNLGYYLSGTSCVKCPAGYYCPDGLTKKTCANGKWSNDGQSSVCTTDCTAGYICKDGTRTICPAGSYSGAGASACTNCNAGYYCTGGANHTACAGGKWSTDGRGSACTDNCEAGYACNNGLKSPCGAGTYSAAGASACTNCNAGYYCTGGTNHTACAAGKYSSTLKAINSSVCKNCAAGTYSSAGAASCTACAAGKTSSAGASSCSNCNVSQCSKYSSGCTCSGCNTGYKVKDGACTSCGSTCSTYSSGCTCSKCVAGYYIKDNKCTVCPTGYYCKDGKTATACATGKTTDSTKSTAASDCVCDIEGGYGIKADNSCKKVPSGWVWVSKGLLMTSENVGDGVINFASTSTKLNKGGNCTSNNPKTLDCYWVNATRNNCSGGINGYKACNRTVATWYAANKACASARASGISNISLPTSSQWNSHIYPDRRKAFNRCFDNPENESYCGPINDNKCAKDQYSLGQWGCNLNILWIKQASDDSLQGCNDCGCYRSVFWSTQNSNASSHSCVGHAYSTRCTGHW